MEIPWNIVAKNIPEKERANLEKKLREKIASFSARD
jgi:hypothetical protein